MRKKFITSVLIIIIGLLVSGIAFANESARNQKGSGHPPKMDSANMQQNDNDMSSAGHKPPPQAYEDCKGKKAGDTVQHTTPEGVVEATCEDSPEGLVARPNNNNQN